MQEYFKRQTIQFTLPAPQCGWGGVDFVVIVYKQPDDDDKIVINKSDCNLNTENEYVATIPSATTANMRVGVYNVEVALIRGSSVDITYDNANFQLSDSAYSHL